MKTPNFRIQWFLLVLFAVLVGDRASGQIFSLNYSQNPPQLLSYNFDGTFINSTTLATNLPNSFSDADFVASDGTDIFVSYSGSGVIGEYTLSGGIINTSLVAGLSSPSTVAISGTNLYVGEIGRASCRERV